MFEKRSINGRVIESFDDESLIGATVSIIGTSIGTTTIIEWRLQLCRATSGDIQIRISGTDVEKGELPNDLDLLGEIVSDIC